MGRRPIAQPVVVEVPNGPPASSAEWSPSSQPASPSEDRRTGKVPDGAGNVSHGGRKRSAEAGLRNGRPGYTMRRRSAAYTGGDVSESTGVTDPSGIEFRPLALDDVPAAERVAAVAFGEAIVAPLAESMVARLPLGRSLGAFAAGELVGTSAVLDLELTVPGRRQVPAAGLTWVTVLPTHRRRGILRALMERQLAAARDRGDVVSCLLASESHLYGRFGYGPATFSAEACIDVCEARFRAPATVPGRMRLLSDPDPVATLGPIWDEVRRTQVGAVSREPVWWELSLRKEEAEPGQLLVVIHEVEEGGPDGYAVYRFVSKWHEGLGQGRVVVSDLASPRPEVRSALWRYLLETDLASEVCALRLPVDDGLRWQLLEPRRLRTLALVDDLWVRPLDVRACLETRSLRGDRPSATRSERRPLPEQPGVLRALGGGGERLVPHGARARPTSSSTWRSSGRSCSAGSPSRASPSRASSPNSPRGPSAVPTACSPCGRRPSRAPASRRPAPRRLWPAPHVRGARSESRGRTLLTPAAGRSGCATAPGRGPRWGR